MATTDGAPVANITADMAAATGLGAALDAGLALATRLVGKTPQAPGVVPYTPSLLSPDQIRSVFENAAVPDYGAAEAGMAQRRQEALKAQLASLDTAHQQAVQGLNGAYSAVMQQLGVAQRNVGAGFADMVRQQGLVNAQAAQGAQGAQQQAQTMAGSLGLSSVGGQQAAAATDAGIQAMIASGAIDQGLLSANAGAMSQYVGSVAPALSSYGRYGALANLQRASMQAKANAEAASAASGLEDYRRFQELRLQSEQGRSDALTQALLGAQSTNMAATNQARQTNVAATNARNESIWRADVDRQNTILSTGVGLAGKVMEIAQQKEAALASALKSAEETRRWNLEYDLKYAKYLQDSAGLTPEMRDKVGTQAQRIKATLVPYAAAGGYQSLTTKTDKTTGRRVPVTGDAALIDASGKFQPQNFIKWSQETGGNFGNVLAYLASAQMSGTIEDGDAREFIKQIARLEAERTYLDASGMQQDDSNYQKWFAELRKNKDYIKEVKAKEEELTALWTDLTIPSAGGKAGSAALAQAYTELGVPVLAKGDATAPLASRIPAGPEQMALTEKRNRALISAQFLEIQKNAAKSLGEISSNTWIPGSAGGTGALQIAADAASQLKELVRANPWLLNDHPEMVRDILSGFDFQEAARILSEAKKDRGVKG